MSRKTRWQHAVEANKAAHEALMAEARGELSADEVDAAVERARKFDQRAKRPSTGAREIKERPGWFRFDCTRCGRGAEMRGEDLPVAFSKGFRPAGLCFECREEVGHGA